MLMNSELYSLVLCSFLKIVWIMKFFCTDSIFFYCALQLGGILIPRRGIKPVPSAVRVWSPNNWTTGNSLHRFLLIKVFGPVFIKMCFPFKLCLVFNW